MAVVLVVDDRRINRELLASLLGHAGHDVCEAADGLEALGLARKIRPDLVITDVLMPTMDGTEFTRLLRADAELGAIPVMFYTATYRLDEAREIGESCGVRTVISKPCEPQDLLDAVQRELGLAELNVAAEQAAVWSGRASAVAVDRLCAGTVEDLTGMRRRLRERFEGNVSRPQIESWKARELNQLSAQLDGMLTHAQALSLRLAALVELNLELAARTDPGDMLDVFCRAARDILNARLAAVCMLHEGGGILEYRTTGMPDADVARVRESLVPTEGVFSEIMRSDTPARRHGLRGGHTALGFPAAHPDFEALLIVPVKSQTRTYGWFYVVDRLGADEFSSDDEEFALILATQLGLEFENLVLNDQLRRQAGLLQVESDERQRVAENLLESETRFRQLAESVREIFFLLDARTGSALYLSPAFEHVWDRSRESLYAEPQSWIDAVHPDDYRTVLAEVASARNTGRFSLKFRIQTAQGVRWVQTRSFPVYDSYGELHRIAGTAEDITESEQQSRRLDRLSRIQAVLSGINSAIVRIHERGALLDEACRIAVSHGKFEFAWVGLVTPKSGRIEFVSYHGTNPRLADRLSGVLVDESVGKHGLCAEALEAESHAVHNDLRQDTASDRACRLALENGYRSAVAMPIRPDRRTAGALILFAREPEFFDAQELRLLDELARDISFALEYIAREEQLNHLAYYDALTDLPNTSLFQEHLTKSIGQQSKLKTALFLVDLDRFTHLNDSFGRHVGDELLTRLAKRLRSLFAIHGDLARIGSDTFAIAVPGLREPTEAGTILKERIFGTLNRPFEIEGRELRISARAGVSLYPEDGQDAITLFKNAEAALKEAKTSGARYLFYSPQLNERVAEDLELEQELLVALERQQFEMFYQPKLDARSGAVVGLEALIRWRHPKRGLISPAFFIPALEASELILDVGSWALERTIQDHIKWKAEGLSPPRVAVNVSPLQLRYSDFPDMILSTIDRHGIAPEMLELEITETAIMEDIETSIGHLQRIAAAGVTIAIDDFGTGYSSLRYLARLPLHAIKVDRSFVSVMTSDADSMTIVSTIISLAHAFDLTVVAEGVESEEQAKFLRLMNCDIMQGYLYGKPEPFDETAKLLGGTASD